MEIRKLRADDFQAQAELSMYAFQFALTEEQIAEERAGFKPEHTWGAFDGDRLAAKATVLPLELYLNGRVFQMGGVAGVATWPEERRQGHVAKLLTNAFAAMRAEGQTISCLHPFSFAFYRKFGYENYIDYRTYTIPRDLLPARVPYEGTIRRVGGDIGLLGGIYAQYAAQYNGMLVRTEEWWKQSVLRRKKGHAAVYFDGDGKPGGYVLYEVKQNVLTVHELAPLNEQAREALWTFLANHDSMIEQAVVNAPADDMLPYLVANPRFKQEIVPYFMARIIDFKPFVERYPFEPQARPARLAIGVTDAHAPWNEGVWELAFDGRGGASAVRRGDGQAADGTVDARCGIQDWTAMLFGYKRPAALHRAGRLSATAEAAALLEAAIPARTTYLLDFF